MDYKDDKSFPFIALTLDDPFPAIKYTREKHRAGTRYFGPYTDARAARETIEVVRRVYPICRATCVEWKRVTAKGGEPTGKPCFDYHVGKGPGPCVGAITREAYARAGRRGRGVPRGQAGRGRRRARAAHARGRGRPRLRARGAAPQLARRRARVLERQRVVSDRPLDMDVIGIEREETIAGVHVLAGARGSHRGRNEFTLDKGLDVRRGRAHRGLPAALLRHGVVRAARSGAAGSARGCPRRSRSGSPASAARCVRLAVPQRGEKRALAELAATNARHSLARYKHRTRYDEERLNRALLELESALALPAPPLRIECLRHLDASRPLTRSARWWSSPAVAPTRPRTAASRCACLPRRANDVAMMRRGARPPVRAGAAGDTRFAQRPGPAADRRRQAAAARAAHAAARGPRRERRRSRRSPSARRSSGCPAGTSR